MGKQDDQPLYGVQEIAGGKWIKDSSGLLFRESKAEAEAKAAALEQEWYEEQNKRSIRPVGETSYPRRYKVVLITPM